jgi:hypothetical protein
MDDPVDYLHPNLQVYIYIKVLPTSVREYSERYQHPQVIPTGGHISAGNLSDAGIPAGTDKK